jgi:hypothetical protein
VAEIVVFVWVYQIDKLFSRKWNIERTLTGKNDVAWKALVELGGPFWILTFGISGVIRK